MSGLERGEVRESNREGASPQLPADPRHERGVLGTKDKIVAVACLGLRWPRGCGRRQALLGLGDLPKPRAFCFRNKRRRSAAILKKMGQHNSNFELASEARRAAERCESLSRQRFYSISLIENNEHSLPTGQSGTEAAFLR